MTYKVWFYLKNSRMIGRTATERDRAMLTGDWDLQSGTKFIGFNFEHPDSPPLCINLDMLDYIDFVVIR